MDTNARWLRSVWIFKSADNSFCRPSSTAIFISISCNRLSFSRLVLATDVILNECYHGILALDPFSSLQRSVFMSGRGFSYFAETPGLLLSLKCMANGRALYKFGRAEVAVDDGGYLILNDRQPYSIEIASPTRGRNVRALVSGRLGRGSLTQLR